MPFGETRVEERKRLIELWEIGWTPTELARKFEVSRPTVYEWIERWQNEGNEGLADRCSRPHTSPKQTGSAVVAALLNMKDRYPRWGPDKLVRLLRDDQIELSASTARDILRRNGRVQARRARPPHWSPSVSPKIVIPGVGHSMSADHKGQFRMGNGRYCFPLTIADPASRFIFAITGQSSTKVEPSLAVFERVFREWGLPDQMITDNGCPFCTNRALGGLTELSKMWIKLEIQHTRIVPGRPQQNGIHERMHRTLKQEATTPPKANMKAQEQGFDDFRQKFNYVRPHQALGQERPASLVKAYRRPYPDRIPAIEYPSSFEVRTVRSNGQIKWKGELLFVSEVLRDELVGLVQVEDDRWDLHFGSVHLATWNERRSKFEAPSTPDEAYG
ncbi:MAG TPA: integrase core domain-containing protein [Thermoanaerobaculia bacterium]|nr:integrase core domain-containing protein [Thermoanaerobaculia bacterium]